jgi:hypothetical protein
MTNVDDTTAFEHYDDPTNREPVPGAPERRRDRSATREVSVSLRAETIEEISWLADADGITVNAWIRRAVERTLSR